MSATKLRLLRAACDSAGGIAALADRLGMGEAMLHKYISGELSVPDPLLLRALDFILAERQSQLPPVIPSHVPPLGEPAAE